MGSLTLLRTIPVAFFNFFFLFLYFVSCTMNIIIITIIVNVQAENVIIDVKKVVIYEVKYNHDF